MGSLKNEGGEFMEAILYVNGVRRVLPDGLAHMTLLEYLRGALTLLHKAPLLLLVGRGMIESIEI